MAQSLKKKKLEGNKGERTHMHNTREMPGTFNAVVFPCFKYVVFSTL